MTYQETLEWMFRQLPMYQQKGKAAFNAKLDKTLSLASHLGHPEREFKSIHVGGTNGKGSSSHMLASILQEAGYSVGLYTSPHLKDFRERIKINGTPVREEYVTDFIAKHYSFLTENGLSFFEMTVGMAFAYFADEKVDIAVIEVGLGGRLDSTNIILPELSLITNIGLDHTDMLGDTLEAIAYEKAGIIKAGIPVVISEHQAETAKVFEAVAAERGAALTFADQDAPPSYHTALLGAYQQKNSNGAVIAIKKLRGFEVTAKHIENGLQNVVANTGLLGRWQHLQKEPVIVCDTAHNVEGLTVVLQQLQKQPFDTLHIVLGFVKGKDLNNILPLFPTTAQYYFCCPGIARGLQADVLRERAADYGLFGKSYTSVQEALKASKSAAKKSDLIFIGGSTFVVAEVL
ncbi:bifunctional folylpolyglutamate synthase/dihydrofolate synthase [Maribacter sp. 2-571]|uniref:bifunctional folylpolyglutamate synthase/dihydrofolate synthase n=1 Tax=Maribacter sp. 2-571 TaxID=3417569 RepID=UPI003D33BFDD